MLIGAGGTAGHVVPALAVADALREQGVTVSFVGGDRAERTLVPEAGYPFTQLRVAGLSRTSPRAAAAAAWRAAFAYREASALIRRTRPDVVLAAAATSPAWWARRPCVDGCRSCSLRPIATLD